MSRLASFVLLPLAWFSLTLPAAAQQRFPGERLHDEALNKARAEGRLMLAVCSGAGDRNTQKVFQLLKEDPKLRRMAAEFVVVFVDADFQTPTVNNYNHVAKVKGDAPWVFAVAPIGQGKVVDGAADLKDAESIQNLLLSALTIARLVIPPKDEKKYATGLEKAKQMMEQDNTSQALAALGPAMKIRGYSESVSESRELWQTIAKKAQDDVAECEKLVEDPASAFAAAVLVTEIKHRYSRLPVPKKAAEQITAKIAKIKEGSALMAQGQEIVKARELVHAGKGEAGAEIYRRLIQKYPGTPVSEMAETELKAAKDKPAASAKKPAAS